MTCKDCIHYEACREYDRAFWGHTSNKHSDLINAKPEDCPYFKDRSRFVELQQAEWIEKIDNYGEPFYRCSECNEEFVLEEGTPEENNYFFCPYCGAEMKFCGLKRSRTGVEGARNQMIIKICDKCGEGYRASEEHVCHEKNVLPQFSKSNIDKYLEGMERENDAE